MRVIRWKNSATGVESLNITATGIYFPVGKEDGAFVARYVMAAGGQTASIEDVRSPAGDRVGNPSISVSGTTEVIARNRRSLAYGIAVTAISGTLTATLDDLVVRTNWPDNLGRFTAKEDADAYTYGGTGLDGCGATIAGVPSVYTPGAGWRAEQPDNVPLSSRTPSKNDDASRGYAVGSVWRYGKSLYSCIDASSGSAVWAIKRIPAILPGDVNPSKAAVIGGTVRCVSGYSGYAIDISVTIASTPTVASIGLVADGELDNDAVSKMYGRADAGTYIKVIKIYDQSGNGNHLTEQAGYGTPVLDWSFQQKRWIICGNLPTSNSTLANTSVTFPGNNFTVIAIGEASNFASTSAQIAAVGTVAGGAYSGVISTLSGLIQDFASGGTRSPSTPLSIESTPCITQFTRRSATRDWWCNERFASNNVAPPSATLTGAWINNATASGVQATCGLRGCVWGFFNQALTASELEAVRFGAYAAYGITPQRRNKIFLVGDSRINSGGTTNFRTPAIALAEALGDSAPVIYSLGVSSQQQDGALVNQYPNLIAMKEAGHRNLVISLQAINDFIVGGKTVEQAISSTMANAALVKAAGILFSHFAELATKSTVGGANTKLPLYRDALKANSSWLDALIDVSSSAFLMSPANVAAYTDGVHQTEAANNILASYAREVVYRFALRTQDGV